MLIGYVAVSGLRSTVLKGLQTFGAGHPIGGVNPISFCNVFLICQLMVGLALLLAEPATVRRDLRRLDGGARRLIALSALLILGGALQRFLPRPRLQPSGP